MGNFELHQSCEPIGEGKFDTLKDFRSKKSHVEEHIIGVDALKVKKDLRYGDVCSQTHLNIQSFIIEQYGKLTSKDTIKKVLQYFDESRDTTFSLDIFYRTIQAQKEFNRAYDENTYLVYRYFQQTGVLLGKTKVDGIAGEQTGQVLDFLLYVKGKREQTIGKQEGVSEFLEVRDIKALGDILANKILKKASLLLLDKNAQGIELSVNSIHAYLVEIHQELQSESHTSKNPFYGDMLRFFENFIVDQRTGKLLIQTFINSLLGIQVSDSQKISHRLQLLGPTVGFMLDNGTLYNSTEIQNKLSQLKKIPAFGKFLQIKLDENSQQSAVIGQYIEPLVKILPELSKLVEKKEVVDFFNSKEFLDNLEYLLVQVDKKDSLEYKKQIDIFTVHITNFILQILPKVNNSPEKIQIVEKIFNLPYLQHLKNTAHYQLIQKIIEKAHGDVESTKHILTVATGLIQLFKKYTEKGQKLESGDYDEFENELKKAIFSIDPKLKDEILGLIQSTYTDLKDAPFWLIQGFMFEFFSSFTVEGIFSVKRASIKQSLQTSFMTTIEASRKLILGNINKGNSTRNSSELSQGLGTDALVKLSELVKRKLAVISSSGDSQFLTKKEIIDELIEVTKGLYAEFPPEYVRSIIETLFESHLAEISTSAHPINYILDTGIGVQEPEKTLAFFDFFADTLYGLSQTASGLEIISVLATRFAQNENFSSLLSVKILGKSLIESFLELIKYIPKSEFKMVLFENTHLISQLVDVSNEKSEQTTFLGMQLIYKFIKKAKISPNNLVGKKQTSLEQFIVFLQTSRLEPDNLSHSIESGAKVFRLLQNPKRYSSPQIFDKKFGRDITLFSQNLFILVHKYLKHYGKQGVPLLLSKQIYQDSSSMRQEKDIFMGGIAHEFMYANIFTSLGTLFFAGFDSKLAKENFFYDYFSDERKKTDFTQKVFDFLHKQKLRQHTTNDRDIWAQISG